ncbi:MAG: hypothetical protein ABJA98_20625 [Acidobacteriota bacterium]
MDLLGEGVQLLLNRGDLFELDILFIAHLKQEVFHTRETPSHGLHDGGYDGLDLLATRRGLFWHSAHSTTGRPVLLDVA